MHRLKTALFLSYIVMLTGCASNANILKDIGSVQPEVYVVETDSEIGVDESVADETSEETEQ